jgi:hypothetical protein
MIKNFEELGEFEKDFQKCWLYCVWQLLIIEWCKKRVKKRLLKSRACVPLSDKPNKSWMEMKRSSD